MCLHVLQDLDPYTGCWSWSLSWGCSSLLMPHPLVWSSDCIPRVLRVWAFHLFLLPYGTWAAPRIRKFQPWKKRVQISNHFRSFSRNVLLPVPLLITLVLAMVWVQSVAVAQVSKLTHRTIIRFPTRFPLWGEVFRRRWSWPAETTCSEANLSQFQKHQILPFSRFELVIVWKIQIDEEGKVFPKLDLLTKVPERGRTPCLQAPFPEDFSVYPTKPSECLIWVYMGRIKSWNCH